MTPQAARSAYRRQLSANGETVILRRLGHPDAPVLARITGFTAVELASGLMQGDRKVILLAEDLERAGLPEPVRPNDGIFVRGDRLNVESVDDSTRRIAGTLIAYELGVKGA